LLHAFTGIATGTVFFFILASTVQSPEERELYAEKNKMEAQYRCSSVSSMKFRMF
jgi:hypothetical protein